MFTSSPEQYQRNTRAAAHFKASPALLSTADGEQLPAVLLRDGAYIRAVMPIPAALKLANAIADAVDAHDTRTTA